MEQKLSRRRLLSASALSAAVGIKAAELPDLTIKEVKVYVTDAGRLAGIVTAGGIEGNYTLGSRYWHPDWNNEGWREYAKRLLIGKNALDRAALTSQWAPPRRRRGQNSYASAIDNCLWDIAGKSVGLPVYRVLGAYRDRVLAYASSQHLKTIDEFVGFGTALQGGGIQGLQDPPSRNTARPAAATTVSTSRSVRRSERPWERILRC